MATAETKPTGLDSEAERYYKRLAHAQQPSPLPSSLAGQYGWSYTIVLALSSLCWVVLPQTGPMFSALVFLLAIVIAGTWWSRGPVLVLAVLSAVVWNFLFIPPQFTLHIASPQDAIMFSLFFVVALAMGHLTTRLKQREQALAKEHRQRESLQAQKHRAELAAQSERLHRTLLDSASHELKTPLTVIKAALDGLDAQNPYVAEIETATLRLQHIVQGFLEMTRAESQSVKPTLDWCELEDLLQAATQGLSRELQRNPIQVNCLDAFPLVKTDGKLLSLAMANILHNACLHSPAGKPIELSFSLPAPPHAASVPLAITIRDHGPGIPEGMELSIFRKFFRAPNAPAGGTGLGLAITKAITRRLGGKVSVCNATDGGARFLLTVPVATKSLAPFPESTQAPCQPQQP